MMPNYNYWQAALAGEKPKMFVDSPELGFYRKGVYERDAKGNNRRVGWTPVAIFMGGEAMIARVGSEKLGRDVVGDELNELWSYVAGNAISEGNYREVAEHDKRWWDDPAPPNIPENIPAVNIPAVNRDVTRADNDPPAVLTDKDHAAAIDNAIAAAIKAVTNETEAAQALGSKNRIAELRLAADKAGKAEYEPPYAEYKRLYGAWNPPVKRAEAKEKELGTIVLTFRERERKRIAAEQAAVDAKQREIDEANERAAQRAIAASEPEVAPEIVEVEQPAHPAPIQPTYGTRRVKEEMKTFLDEVTDYEAVYRFFKTQSRGQVETFLKDLAERAIKAGFEVPGCKTRKGLI